MAKEALAAFEATLKKEPHRLGATLSAAKAAEKAGDAQRTSIEELRAHGIRLPQAVSTIQRPRTISVARPSKQTRRRGTDGL
jgi:hypothetical protein